MHKYLGILTMMSIATLAQGYDFPTYEEYIAEYNKNWFGNDAVQSKANYEKNINIMQSITEYTPGVNQLTDLSDAVIAKMKKSKVKNGKESDQLAEGKLGAPTSKDWRDEKIISPVKDQLLCGSGWAFAPIAYAEAKVRSQGEDGALLSDQYVLECSGSGNCDGGYIEDGMNRIIEGTTPENWYSYYPEYNYPGICSNDQGLISAGDPLYSYYDLKDQEIINLLQQSPLVASVSAQNWEYYGSGVFSCSPTDPVNHAVLLVGYTDQYWIAKNSWGRSWGQKGYIRILRDPENDCKIGTSVYKTFEMGLKVIFVSTIVLISLFFL